MLDLLTDEQALLIAFTWFAGCLLAASVLASKASWFTWEEPADKEGGVLGALGSFFN